MASKTQDGTLPLAPSSNAASMSPGSRRHEQQQHQQLRPSPPTDDFQTDSFQIPPWTSHRPPYLQSDANPPPQSPRQPEHVVDVRDLAHVQTLAGARGLGATPPGVAGNAPTKYEISGMPMGDIIEMVAALLTKITTTNDLQHDALQRNAAHQQQASQTADAPGGANNSPLSHSVLAFHGKNVPAITILSYLSRIHKYCPTTYEVFLSLLVYFDRMTERVNDMVVRADAPARDAPTRQDAAVSHEAAGDESDSDLADDDDAVTDPSSDLQSGEVITVPERHSGAPGPVTCFVVDSFNIHRLIIAGVTCASKFFSDVFYTNSRYAKVRFPRVLAGLDCRPIFRRTFAIDCRRVVVELSANCRRILAQLSPNSRRKC